MSVAKGSSIAPSSGAAPHYGPGRRIKDPLHLGATNVSTLPSTTQMYIQFDSFEVAPELRWVFVCNNL